MPQTENWLRVPPRKIKSKKPNMLVMIFYRNTLICGHCQHLEQMTDLPEQKNRVSQFLHRKHLKTHRKKTSTACIHLIKEGENFQVPQGCSFDEALFKQTIEQSPDFLAIQQQLEAIRVQEELDASQRRFDEILQRGREKDALVSEMQNRNSLENAQIRQIRNTKEMRQQLARAHARQYGERMELERDFA